MNDETNTILSTKDYNKFVFLDNNREQKRPHIEALKRGFKERGNLTQISPVIVNEKMEVIDGQHRIIAASELGVPVFYTVNQGLRVDDARAMNILQRSWGVDDYAHSYANSGIVAYQKFLALKEEYGFNNTATLHAAVPGRNMTGVFKKFRNGEFELDDASLEKAKLRLSALNAVEEWVPMVNNRAFDIAYFDVMDAPGFEQERMERKLSLVGSTLLQNYSTPSDFRRALEEIYNYNQGEATRVRLY